jgi:hypothetical protein
MAPLYYRFARPQTGRPRDGRLPGAGGSLGYADPQAGIDAHVTNRMGTALTGDPRDLALRDALARCTT